MPDTTHLYLTAGFRSGPNLVVLARSPGGETMITYIPDGSRTPVTINLTGIPDPGRRAKCWWTNPSTGANTLIGAVSTDGQHTFTAPDSSDWVLTLDSDAAKLCAPGTCTAKP